MSFTATSSAKAPSGGAIKRAIVADLRKTTVLAILLLVLAVLGWRMLDSSAGPAASSAATVAAVPAGLSGPHAAATTDNVRPSRAGTAALAEWSNAPVSPLGRNLFALRADSFVKKSGISDELLLPGSFWTQLAKSLTVQTDLQSSRKAIVDAIIADAAKLKLSSTIMGTKPRAIVNEQVVEVGDVVASFRVLTIEARGITVEREGIRLEIQMK